MAIKGFKSKALKRLAQKGDRRGVSPQSAERIDNIPAALDSDNPMKFLSPRTYKPMIAGMKDTDWLRQNPPHPGRFFKRSVLDAWEDYPGMTLTAAARALGVNRVTLNRVVHGQRPITLNLAMKMEAAGWATADAWVELQAKYDIAQARKRLNQPLAAAPAEQRVKRLMAEAA